METFSIQISQLPALLVYDEEIFGGRCKLSRTSGPFLSLDFNETVIELELGLSEGSSTYLNILIRTSPEYS